MGNKGIRNKFDDIDIRVDFLIEFCQSLQEENKRLVSKIKTLESALDEKAQAEAMYAEQESMVKSKIDGLLEKLDGFSNNLSSDGLSSV